MISNEKFRRYEYADILWMEDIDTQGGHARQFGAKAKEDNDYLGQDIPESFVKTYIPKKYRFRLHPYKYVKETLEELEKNLSLYSCVILDINMANGFHVKYEDEEFDYIKKVLAENNVIIKGEDKDKDEDKDDDQAEFKKNAGFYIYLYLLHRGMPADRIAILTGNETEEKRKVFLDAGIKMPVIIEKQDSKIDKSLCTNEKSSEKNTPLFKWLKNALDDHYRLRSCMVIMSTYVLEALDNCESSTKIYYDAFKIKKDRNKNDKDKKDSFLEDAKLILHDLQNIPLRLPKTESEKRSVFKSLIAKIAHPWEATERKYQINKNNQNNQNNKKLPYVPYAYWITMRMTRNWLAHDIIKDENKSGFKNLWTMAFLFGVGMRGMFDLQALLKDKFDEYCEWENELLALIIQEDNPWQTLTISDSEAKQKMERFRNLIIRSHYELYDRSKDNINGALTNDVGWLLFEMGQKEKNNIPCCEMDLVRNFLHGITLLEFELSERQDLNQLEKYKVFIGVDYNSQAQYYDYLCKKDGSENREWDYIESVRGHIENELSRLLNVKK